MSDDNSRSYSDFHRGQQLYAVVEFCQSAKALWGKVASGQYDWLGVREKDKRVSFVVGRPPVGRHGGHAALSLSKAGATGAHRVTIEVPHNSMASAETCATSDDARRTFREAVERCGRPDGSSGLYRVRLYIDNVLVDEHFVAKLRSNLL